MAKPGDVQADSIKVPKDKRILAPQTCLAEQGPGNFAATPEAPAAPSAGYQISGWTAANSPSGNSDVKPVLQMEQRIISMEKRVVLIPSVNRKYFLCLAHHWGEQTARMQL
jgi:hypothetical protein